METFKDIPWYEWLYQISNLWVVISLNYRGHWIKQKRKLLINKFWYIRISLCVNCKIKEFSIHALVMLTFIWIRPIEKNWNKYQINHKNWIKHDNRLSNLEYCTASENNLHAFRILKRKANKSMLWKFWKLHHNSKQVSQFTKKGKLIRIYNAVAEAVRETGITNIWLCVLWKLKTSWWFIWKYT